MHVSLSEVETTVCKAAMAVGLPLGLGEDAGRAARRMMALGVGSFAAFCDALDAVDQRRSTGFDLEPARTGVFGPKPAGRLLSAIRAGPSACDLVVAAARTNMSREACVRPLQNPMPPNRAILTAMGSVRNATKAINTAQKLNPTEAISAWRW